MERDYALAVLQGESRRVLDLVCEDEGRLGRDVPCCPGWTLTDVVKHLGNVYNWAGTIVGGRLLEPPSRDAMPERPQQMAYPEWMANSLERLVGALADIPDEASVWTFSAAEPQAPAFWWRRQAHETLIHRVDAEVACEMAITSVEPFLGADNLSELFSIYAFSFSDDEAGGGEAAAGKSPPGSAAAIATDGDPPHLPAGWPATVHLHATDLDGAEWTIDTASRSVSRRHSKADMALRGPAWALARWCWGRPALTELEAFGNLDAGETWRKSFVA
jgi:uncharacterized protein (TIGR03083 family)